MDAIDEPFVAALAGVGIVVGLVVLWRGFLDYRTHLRVADTSTSTIASIAAGEVRVSGVIEAAELTLVSLLQSIPCVYYRATVGSGSDERTPESGFTEERSIGFQVRDATGTLRIFPRDAQFDAPVLFEGETDLYGDEPSGLDIRRGGSSRPAEPERAAAVATLLEEQGPADPADWVGLGDRRGRHSYREARLGPGDPVTIVGRALPFSDLADPNAADAGSGYALPLDDPEVAADLAAARVSGILAGNAVEAWGNAAIAGFGIGRPVSEPTLDADATPLPLADEAAAASTARRFEIEPETLVIAASGEVPLLIAFGVPGAVVARSRDRFAVGLLGALLAIVSAMVLAISLGGGIVP